MKGNNVSTNENENSAQISVSLVNTQKQYTEYGGNEACDIISIMMLRSTDKAVNIRTQ